MRCASAREALSARLDDELDPAEQGALDAHLATCQGCRDHRAALERLHRHVRLQPADRVPDLSAAIVDAVAASRPRPATRPARPRWAGRLAPPPLDLPRAALAVVAATQLAMAVPLLVLAEGPGAGAHVTRELGAFSLAFAAGLLVVVWQPRRATGLLPVAVALAAAMVLGGLADLAAGRATVLAESHHLLELAGLGLLHLVARDARSAPRAGLAPAS